MHLLKILTIALLGTVVPAVVSAQPERPWALHVSAALSLVPSSDGVSSVTVAPLLEARYTLGSRLHLSAEWGGSIVTVEREGVGSESRVDIGNPLLGVGYRLASDDRRIDGGVGVRLGVPLATFPGAIPDNRLSEFNLNNAVSAYGWRNPFVWLMNVVPLVADAHVHVVATETLGIKARVSPAMLLSVNRQPSRFAASTDLDIGYALAPAVLRVGWSYFFSGLSLENNDRDQHSIRVGSDLQTGESSALKLDLVVNIDAPNGIAVDAPKPTWGIVVGYGTRF